MGNTTIYPTKNDFAKNIDNYLPAINKPTKTTGKYLNWLLKGLLERTPYVVTFPTKNFTALIEQSVIDTPPNIVPNSDLSPGKAMIDNFGVGDISFTYVGIGHYEMKSASGAFGDEANKVKTKGKTKKTPREGYMEMRYVDSSTIEIKTYLFEGPPTLADDLLDHAIIEVEVFA